MTTRRTCVIVTGVGRSGTSLCTRVVSTLGVPMSSRLIPASDDNPTGFFEDADVVAVHDTLVGDLELSPLLPLPAGWADAPATRRAARDLGDIVADAFGSGDRWAVKDPRIGWLWPLWQAVLDESDLDAEILYCTRHSTSVVDSIRQAYGLGRSRSHGLVLFRSFHALSTLPPQVRFVPYEWWWRDPRRLVREVAEACGATVDDDAIDGIVGDLVRGDLDRSGSDATATNLALRELDAFQQDLVGVAEDRRGIEQWCRDVEASLSRLDMVVGTHPGDRVGARVPARLTRRARAVIPPGPLRVIRRARDRVVAR